MGTKIKERSMNQGEYRVHSIDNVVQEEGYRRKYSPANNHSVVIIEKKNKCKKSMTKRIGTWYRQENIVNR